MSLATISIVGNLAKEPEQHQFASGRIKTTLHVAVNSFNQVRKEKSTDFYRVEIWDRLGDLAKSYLKKGNQITVSGRFALEKWVDREGKDRVTPIVQANQLAFPPRPRPYTNNAEADLEASIEEYVGSVSHSRPQPAIITQERTPERHPGWIQIPGKGSSPQPQHEQEQDTEPEEEEASETQSEFDNDEEPDVLHSREVISSDDDGDSESSPVEKKSA